MQLEFRYRFEAAHRFLSSESAPCMTPHGHSWYATLCLEFTGANLDHSDMTVEFSKIKKDWRILIDQVFDHSYMHHYNDPVAEVLRGNQPEPRLLAFPGDPTTEMIALFMFHKMEQVYKAKGFASLLRLHSVRLEETPTNSLICNREFYTREINRFKDHKAWWNSTELEDRRFALN